MTTPALSPDLLSSFASSESEAKRQELFSAEQSLQRPEAVTALCDQALQWAREDPLQARKAAAAALWLAKSIDDRSSEALAHRTLANTLTALEQHSAAVTEYTSALNLFLAVGDDLQAAITRNSALAAVAETLSAEVALDWAAKAREVFQATGDQLRLARLDNNTAVMLFRQEDFANALRQWKLAHATLEQIGETSDQAATLHNLAVCCISLNKPKQARTYYKQARELCVAHNFTYSLHEIDYNIAYLHYLQGDHHRALQIYQAARSRSRELGDRYHEALCSLDEAEVYAELNLLQEAETVAQLAASQFKDQERLYEAAKALFILGLVRARRGDPRSALDHLRAASKAFEGQGNILWPGQVELLRASVFAAEGRFFEARRSAALARDRFLESGLGRRASFSALLLAKVCHAQGLFSEAEDLCRTSLRSLASIGEPASLFQAYFVLGRILDSQGDSEGAFSAFSSAEEYLLELRERRSALQMQVSVVENPLEVYAYLVGLLIGHDSVAPLTPEVFRLVQTAKARSYADLAALSGAHTRPATTMRSQLVDQVSNLRQELSWLYRRIDRTELPESASSSTVVESLQAQSRAKEVELSEKLSALRVSDPASGAGPDQAGIADIDRVQGLLRGNVLLEFFVAHDIVLGLILSKDSRYVVPVAVTSTVRDLQRKAWNYLHHYTPPSVAPRRSTQPLLRILDELYSELLLPIEEYLGDSPLIIAPHDFLSLLPFHALRRNGEYLIDRSPVSYAPSSAALASAIQAGPAKVRRLGVLGGSKAEDLLAVFPDLASSHAEVLRLPTPVPGASDQKQQGGTAFHVAGTARLRADNPLFSTVAVGNEELALLDFFQSTMLGPMTTIEGHGFSPASPTADREVVSLWRALLTSGARAASVPAGYSQPPIHREHARLLYEELLRGEEVGVAHRKATLALRDDGAAVSDWASLFLIGDPFLVLRLANRAT